MQVAVLGLGEAGRLYAGDLVAAGATVTGYDVRDVDLPDGVVRAHSVAEAVRGADLILSLTTAAGAIESATSSGPHLGEHAIYADLNAASPARKVAAAKALGTEQFVDVAILAPVARNGLRTPVLVSGPGAGSYSSLLGPFAGVIDIVDGDVGAASSRKLTRSVFMKCLATTVLEALAAGRAAGYEPWTRAQIVAELGSDGEALVQRLVEGTYEHAERRLHEMEDTRSHLADLGTPTDMTQASITWLAAVGAGERR